MELWWTEEQTPGLRLGLRCEAVVERRQSAYQEIAVYRTQQYGLLLALDDMVMTSEADEFIYHELLVHPCMSVAASPRRVLVVGGGDGGAVREVCKYPEVERVVLAELDPEVIEVSRRHLPALATALDDPRVEICVGDGLAYLAATPAGSFDVILVDAPDPIGPAEGLFSTDFYALAERALAPSGLFAAQTECPLLHGELIRRVQAALRERFAVAGLYWGVVPTYPGSMWSFSCAAKQALDLGRPGRSPAGPTRYWTPAVHRAAFALPPFVRALVEDEPACPAN